MGATSEHIEELLRKMSPVSAPREQQEEVAELARRLRQLRPRQERGQPCKLIGPNREAIAIPEAVFYVLERVAEVLARGDAITLVPVGKELTTQQAADLLNISRQYLVRLLEQDRLPYSKIGKHRRLRIEDVLAYKEARDRERKAQLDLLASMSEEAGGYGELK